jgi:hypothetical protein
MRDNLDIVDIFQSEADRLSATRTIVLQGDSLPAQCEMIEGMYYTQIGVSVLEVTDELKEDPNKIDRTNDTLPQPEDWLQLCELYPVDDPRCVCSVCRRSMTLPGEIGPSFHLSNGRWIQMHRECFNEVDRAGTLYPFIVTS